MAKKRPRQQRIPGTYDEPNAQVREAAEDYVHLLSLRMKTQEKENVAREELITALREHDISECEVDGKKVMLIHKEDDKIRVRTMDDEAETA